MKEKEEEVKYNCHCSEHGEGEKCTCGEDCTCGDNCTCGDDCHCHDDKHDSGEGCNCTEECSCGEDCDCGCECNCGCECSCENSENDRGKCNCVTDEKVLADQYLNLARQIQADFENFRRHAVEDLKSARIDGQKSVIEAFLPCLDTFKEAKKSISDEVVLKGVEMIEDKIVETLKKLGVEKIPSIGEIYNPHLHEAIMVMKDENKDNNIILDEYQAGYKFKDRVIRHSKVIVNKKED